MLPHYKTPDVTKTNQPFYEIANASQTVSGYLKKVSELIKHEYCLGRINIYKYEQMINLITCAQLEVDKVSKIAKREADTNLREFVNRDLDKKSFINLTV